MKKILAITSALLSSTVFADSQPIGTAVVTAESLSTYVAAGHGCLNQNGVSGIGAMFKYGGILFVCLEGKASSGKRMAGWVQANAKQKIAESLNSLNHGPAATVN